MNTEKIRSLSLDLSVRHLSVVRVLEKAPILIVSSQTCRYVLAIVYHWDCYMIQVPFSKASTFVHTYLGTSQIQCRDNIQIRNP